MRHCRATDPAGGAAGDAAVVVRGADDRATAGGEALGAADAGTATDEAEGSVAVAEY
jgi:hypothetical protein